MASTISTPRLLYLFGIIFGVTKADFELGLIHTNDIHSRITQTNKYSASCSPNDADAEKCYGGVARMWTKIKELRGLHENSLLVDSGDQFQGTLWSNLYEGQEASHFMNWLQYDIMAYGNHDFDYGTQTLADFTRNVSFPLVCSNLKVVADNPLANVFTPSHVFTLSGVKVGFIGYLISHLKQVTDPANLVGIDLGDEIESVRKEAIRLKADGVNIIIALGHSGYEYDQKLASQVEQVDVVVGAHTHTFLYTGDAPSNERPRGEYPTTVLQAGGQQALVLQEYAYSKYLGYINITFSDDGNVLAWNGQPILLDKNVKPDPTLAAEVAEWEKAVHSLGDQVVGRTHVFLGGDTKDRLNDCRVRECNMGNLVSDAMIRSYVDGRNPDTSTDDTKWSDVAVAVYNSGGIRNTLPTGPITQGDIILVLPYRNTIDIVEVTGEVLLEMMENSIKVSQSEPTGGFLQMSGLKVTYNLDKPVGSQVVDVKVRCAECMAPKYEPLEKSKTYKILLSSFMANGGDGYTMIQEKMKSRINVGTLFSDALTQYVQKYSPLINEVEDRISYTTDPPTTLEPSPEPCGAPQRTVATWGLILALASVFFCN